tara:strand:- start:301 stop:591 length:291 start_codon:yes stop_codon:yes gene_type:complete
MKIDYKTPINSSLLSMGITFVITMIILYITKPFYIIQVTEEGKKKKNLYLLINYSLLFSVFVGIVVLLFRIGTDSPIPTMGFANPRSFNPRGYVPN